MLNSQVRKNLVFLFEQWVYYTLQCHYLLTGEAQTNKIYLEKISFPRGDESYARDRKTYKFDKFY